MGAGGHPLPAIEVDAEEDRLREEGKPLEGERHTDDRTRELHEARPEQSELEREDRPGHRTDGEQNGRAARPALGEIEVDGIARPLPATLREDHEHGHRDPDDGEDDMKRERHRHLRPGGKQIGHDE